MIEIEDNTVDNPYPMHMELSLYIVSLCQELQLDSNLAVSILLKENPQLKTDAININNNGTLDVGLWQLNDRYIWTVFVKNYWLFENVEFNPFDWKHNTYLALHHIQYLAKTLKITADVICAYNAGRSCNEPENTFR